jgi:hypothetical protein
MKVAKPKRLVHTVNVVECIDGVPNNLTAFADDPDGNLKAEELFIKLANDRRLIPEEITIAIEDGYFIHGVNSIFLIHSS